MKKLAIVFAAVLLISACLFALPTHAAVPTTGRYVYDQERTYSGFTSHVQIDENGNTYMRYNGPQAGTILGGGGWKNTLGLGDTDVYGQPTCQDAGFEFQGEPYIIYYNFYVGYEEAVTANEIIILETSGNFIFDEDLTSLTVYYTDEPGAISDASATFTSGHWTEVKTTNVVAKETSLYGYNGSVVRLIFEEDITAKYFYIYDTNPRDMMLQFYTVATAVYDSGEVATTEAPTQAPTEAPATEAPATEAPTTETPATDAVTTVDGAAENEGGSSFDIISAVIGFAVGVVVSVVVFVIVKGKKK